MASIGTLMVAVVSSSVVAAFLTFVLNTRQQERATLREKLEELTSILNRQLVMMKNQLTYVEHMKAGKLSPEELAENLAADAEKEIPFDRVQALIFIYFPNLIPHLDRIVLAQSQMKPALDLDGQYIQTRMMFDAHNQFFARVLDQGPIVNRLWRFWQ